jgi:pyruvate formate lyase activating enzyme
MVGGILRMKGDFYRRRLSRREFFKVCAFSGVTLASVPLLVDILKAAASRPKSGEKGFISKREAMFYKNLDEETIQCQLCPRRCTLSEGMRGFCRAREPHEGKHYSMVYGNPCAIHVDPIEKKPLFHFLPQTDAFSIATAGCNLRCKFCQNWQISQFPPEETVNYALPPEGVVDLAIKYNCPTIAYTYSEPSIFYEYMYDTAVIARERGVKNIYHSNGYLNPEPLKELCKYLDGANVDLKAFTQKFYGELCGATLKPVLNTLKTLKEERVHVEITNLVVPPYNDDMEKLKNLTPTPVETLEKAREVALKAGLEYVYIGNVPGHPGENTYCPRDGKLLIHRKGYQILENNVVEGKCKFCGQPIPGVWPEEKAKKKTELPSLRVSEFLG